jgi:hypothetical protein
MEEVVAAVVFLHLFGVEGVDVALLFFPFFLPHILHCFSSSLSLMLPLSLVSLLQLFL